MGTDEFLKAQMREHGWNIARLAEACDVSDGLAGKWISENERARVTPSPASCEKIARGLGVDADYVLELAGHRPPQTAASATGESLLHARQQPVRDQRDRWVAVLGPRMGEEAAENYFWESLRRLADNILDALTVGTAVSSAADGAVNAAVSRKAKRGRRRDDGASGTLRVRQHPSAELLAATARPLVSGAAA